MKKLSIILFILTYLCFNTGLVLSMHYCGGKLSSLSFVKGEKKKCACGKTKMPKGCCKNTQTQLSIDDNQLSSQTNFHFPDFSSFFIVLPSYSPIDSPDYALLNEHNGQFYVYETGPPKTPVYIQIRSLLI